MSNDIHSSTDDVLLAGQSQLKLTYGEFLQMAKERRLAELEHSNPGEDKRNANIAGNIVRAIRAFMAANGIRRQDVIGEEMLDQTTWEEARDRLGPAKAPEKSLAGKARVWALEELRLEETRHADETFGTRLARLRCLSGLNYSQLSSVVSTGAHRTRWNVIRNWEEGVRRPAPESLAVVQRLEKALNAPPGSLVEKMPKEPNFARSVDIELPRSLKRRVSQHLPADFETRSKDEQEEILIWVGENILSTPKEILDDGGASTASKADVFYFALAQEPGRRTKMASPQLLNEIKEISHYKTAPIPPLGIKRNKRWGHVMQEKADYEIRSLFGALDLLGLPTWAQSISIFLAPEALERFVLWRFERRGAYTQTHLGLLRLITSFLHPETGFLTQNPGYGWGLAEVPGFVSSDTAQLAASDWNAACAKAYKEISGRIKQIEEVVQKGRDPFEALTPVINDYGSSPLFEYFKIADEIRLRMPGPEYPVRLAETQRALMMFMVGLTTGLRSKNLRQLLVCLPGDAPRSEKELRRLRRGEMFWRDNHWWIGIPREAFKNGGTAAQPGSSAIEDWNTFPLEDIDGRFYAEIEAYLEARQILLSGHEDPGTFFVKTMASRARTPEYSLTGFYNAFRSIITTYGVYNPYTDRGAIRNLKPHGPHSVRHVIATHLVKNASIDDAAAALFDSPTTILAHYGRYRPGERHRDAMRRAWAGWGQFQGVQS